MATPAGPYRGEGAGSTSAGGRDSAERRTWRQVARAKKRKGPRSGHRPVREVALPPNVRVVVKPTVGTEGRVPKAAQPWGAEQDFLHIWMLTKERAFESAEEFEQFLSRYMSPGRPSRFPKPAEPWHQAQDLAYRGWREGTARGRQKLAQKALKISPDAPDPYLLLAHDAPSWREAEILARQGLAAAERLVGPDALVEYAGDFWGVAITRPYMRAHFALGYVLWRQGRREEAVEHFQHLLNINPEDNQGARYVLVAILMELKRDGEALRVMDRYSRDGLVHWAYNRALRQFTLRGGEHPRVLKRLQRAISQNRYVPPLLLGTRPVRRWELTMVEPGEESEAVEYLQLYREAWARTPGALDWLRANS